MNKVYIGLGSNLGDPRKNLEKARQFIDEIPLTRITRVSSLYSSRPWGVKDQPDFINQVVEIETGLPPGELLQKLLEIEKHMGRKRLVKWGPRVIDLDILLYGSLTISEEDLQVPHPFLTQREFVVVPLLELEPELALPDGTMLREKLEGLDLTAIERID